MPSYEAGAVTATIGLAMEGLARDLDRARFMIERMAGRNFVARIAVAPVTLGMGAVAGLARLAQPLAEAAMEMESARVRLGRASGLMGEDLDSLADKLKKMGGTMPGVGLGDVFGMATMGAKLGVAGPQLDLFTKDMLRLRTVLDETDLPLAEAVTGIARLAQLFGTGYQATDKFAATLVRLDNLSTASARDILDIAARMGGTLSTFKVAASDTLALAASLREAGVPLETAATSISQIVQRMVSLRDIGMFARTAGMDRRSFEGQVRADPIKALMSVVHGLGRTGEGAGFKELKPIEASRQLEKMHLDGQRVRGTLLALTRVETKLNELLKEGRDEWATTAHFLDAVAAKAGLTESQLTLMWNRIKLLAAEIGAGLLPVLKGFSEGIGGLVEELKGFFAAQRGLLEAWGMRVGRAMGYVKLLWREFPTFVQLGWVKMQEFGDRAAVVLTRFGSLARATFVATFTFLGDLVSQTANIIRISLTNAIKDALMPFSGLIRRWMGAEALRGFGLNKREAPKKIVPDFAPFAGLGGMAGGLFAGLPDRAAQAAPLQGQLRDARRAMEDAAANRGLGGDAEDAVARAKGEREQKAKKFDFNRFREEQRRKAMSPAARAEEDRRKQRQGLNAQMRAQRNAFNAQFRRRKPAPAKPKGVPRPRVPKVGPLDPRVARAREEQAKIDKARADAARDAMKAGVPGRPGADAAGMIEEQRKRDAERAEAAQKAIRDAGGGGGMPAPGKPPKAEEADKQIEAMKAVTTAMNAVEGAIRDLQRTGVAALFG